MLISWPSPAKFVIDMAAKLTYESGRVNLVAIWLSNLYGYEFNTCLHPYGGLLNMTPKIL